MNDEQLPIEQSAIVTGEVKAKRDFNFLYFLAALVIDSLLTIIYYVYPLFRGEELSNLVVFSLAMAISQISLVLGFLTLISFIFLYFFRYQYKMVFLPLVTSVITLAFFLMPLSMDNLNVVWLGVLSASLTATIYFILELKKKTITRKIAYQFYLSLLISIITILLLATSGATNMQSNAKYRNEIDLQRIVPANIMSDYSNMDYKVKYSEDKNSDNYHRVYINLPIQSQFETKSNYIDGIVEVTLSRLNYDQSNPRKIRINNQETTLFCRDSNSCNFYWKTGKYHIIFHASINGDSAYGTTVDKTKVQNELNSIMMNVAKKIEQNSQYLNDSK